VARKGADSSTESGAQAFLHFLEDRGDRHVFGVTGSTMVSVFHALARSPITFVPSVHESAAIAAADGYARVSGAGCVLLYMVMGVANGMANLHNAHFADSPLLIVGSDAESFSKTGLPSLIGEGDLVAMTRSVTRFGAHVPQGSSLRDWLERASRIAAGPPGGPVMLSVPEDVLVGPSIPAAEARSGHRVAPGAPAMGAVADALRCAERPLIVAGSQIHKDGGSPALLALTEQLSIPVAFEHGFPAQMSIGPGHPNYLGTVTARTGDVAAREADVVISVGGRLGLEHKMVSVPRYVNARFVAHVNVDPEKLEGLTTADWTCACSPAAFLETLLAVCTRDASDPSLIGARGQWLAKLRNLYDSQPDPDWGVALSDALDRGWVVDESVGLASTVNHALKGSDGSRFLSPSGASLGWATGAACGVALASGDPVTCILGDGALRFGASGLWTAKASELPITYVVLDNGGFGSTRYFERAYIAESGSPAQPGYIGSDLRGLGPSVAEMIAGYGIPCTSVSAEADVRGSLLRAWDTAGPSALVVDIGFDGGM
jgi:thiamine pyrophosphate-dependent acetolactate synthase large subunit-like protein